MIIYKINDNGCITEHVTNSKNGNIRLYTVSSPLLIVTVSKRNNVTCYFENMNPYSLINVAELESRLHVLTIICIWDLKGLIADTPESI